MQKNYRIIVDVKPRPKPHEYSAAELIADFLHQDICFIQATNSKTPDLLINNQLWEIKSPTGSGTRTIMHQFQRAAKQAKYMIFDSRRVKINNAKCKKQVQIQFNASRQIKRVIFIANDGTISELKKTPGRAS